MRKVVFLLFFAVLLQIPLLSQSCLPNGIHFYSQEIVDNFKINYPNCTEIEGWVWISGDDITNVDSLSVLTSIGGNVDISASTPLLDLSGLINLTSIGGYLNFYEISISNLEGLNNLTSIGGDLNFQDCDSLTSLSGLDKLSYIGNELNIGIGSNLTNMSGLEQLTYIGEDLFLFRTDLVNFEGLNNLTTIGGDLIIYSNNDLVNFTGLSNLTSIGGDFNITKHPNYFGNNSLINFTGLDNLISVGGSIKIEENEVLIDLSGLNNLRTILGNLFIKENHSLSSLEGLNNLDTLYSGIYLIDNENITSLSALHNLSVLAGYIWIQYADKLKSLAGLENLDPNLIHTLLLNGNDSLTVCDVKSICDYLFEPNAIFELSGNAEGCNSKTEIELACEAGEISNYSSLSNLVISPNPVDNYLVVSCDNDFIIKEIYIYNLFGQKVLIEKPMNNKLDLSKLKSGMYMMELISHEGTWKTKVIKQ